MEEAAHCQLAILDVMLPGLDGFTVGQRLKRANPKLPILMLSARTSSLLYMLIANSSTYGPYYPWVQPMLAMMPYGDDSFGAFNLPLETLMIVVGGSWIVYFTAGLIFLLSKSGLIYLGPIMTDKFLLNGHPDLFFI